MKYSAAPGPRDGKKADRQPERLDKHRSPTPARGGSFMWIISLGEGGGGGDEKGVDRVQQG
ncbi:hypothetical protein J2129_001717 [Methanofollis sp. W23]|nr:hypothetical protein [Methanofollis sp. W23]